MGGRSRVTRWLLLGLGLGIAGAGLLALVARPTAPPLDEIGDRSRAELEELLRVHEPAPGAESSGS